MAHVSNAAPGASPGDADALAASLGSVALGEQPSRSDGGAAALGAAAAPAADDGAVIGSDEDAGSASASGDELRAQDATSVLDNAVAALVAVQGDEDRTVSSVVEAMRREGTLLVRFAEAAGSELVDCEGILMLDFVRYGWLQLPEPYSDMFSFCRNYLPHGAEARRFQIDALEALLRGRDVVEVLPCGSGKSLAVAVYCAARAEEARGRGARSLGVWLAPTTALVVDVVRSLQERYGSEWEGRGDFAKAVSSSGTEQLDVVEDDMRTHHVLESLLSGDAQYGCLVMTPEMLKTCAESIATLFGRGIICVVCIDEADDQAGYADSYRPDQASQGQTVAALRSFSPRSVVPIVALSGTVRRHAVPHLIASLGINSGALVLRAPAISTTFELVRMPRDSLLDIVGEALRCGDVLVYAVTPGDVRTLAGELRLGTRVVVAVSGDTTPAEKRLAIDALSGPRSEESPGVVAVVNDAAARGLDPANVRTVVFYAAPFTLESFVQVAGRACRGTGAPGRIVVAFERASLFQSASVVSASTMALAEFVDVVRLVESVVYCWRGLLKYLFGDATTAVRATARPFCCPACDAALEEQDSEEPVVMFRDVRGAIEALVAVVRPTSWRPAPKSSGFASTASRRDGGTRRSRESGRPTFDRLTRRELSRWASPDLSVEGRGRVVCYCLTEGILRLEQAAGSVMFVVEESGLIRWRRHGGERGSQVAFLRGEVSDT